MGEGVFMEAVSRIWVQCTYTRAPIQDFNRPTYFSKLFVLYLSSRFKMDKRSNDGDFGRCISFSDSDVSHKRGLNNADLAETIVSQR